jgi:membrane fusion protein (multidrug efflux system)
MEETARAQKGYRKLTVLVSALILTPLLAGGTWMWKSMAYVSVDDAQIKADIITISPETPGRIALLAKEEGDPVSPGEILARLDTRQTQIQIRQAQADMEHARSRQLQTKREITLYLERQTEEISLAEATLRSYRHDLDDARAHAKIAKEDWHRAKELFIRELISRQNESHLQTEFHQAQARLMSLKEKVKQGEVTLRLARIKKREVTIKRAVLLAREAEVRRAQERLANLRHRLELMTIRSPVKGVVARNGAHQGEFIQPGQPIFMVINSSKFWVEANVEETKIRFVKPGGKAIIRVDSYPGQDFSGTVSQVGEATVSAFSLFSPAKLTGVFVKSTQRLPVKIAVENTNGHLKVGMLAVVWIERNSH